MKSRVRKIIIYEGLFHTNCLFYIPMLKYLSLKQKKNVGYKHLIWCFLAKTKEN